MCMLTAMVPTRQLFDDDIMLGKYLFTSLILRNAATNKDGFGLASTGDISYKTTAAATKVALDDLCIAAVTDALTSPLIGHVRTTSTGRTAKDGSHPFFIGSLAVAHNGTFNNYRAVLKKNKDISEAIDDLDPVDSNVFAHLLGKVKGGSPLLDHKHIETALGEMSGSYAVLVAEKEQEFIWVVRGANVLYQTTVGPYRVINTSKANLVSAADATISTFKLLFNIGLEVPEPKMVDTYGVYKLLASGLEKQADLPKPAVTVTTYDYTGWQSQSYRAPAAASESAMTRSVIAAEIDSLPGVTYDELEIATKTLYESKWYDTRTADLLVVKKTLEVLSSRHHTPAKEFLWKHIGEITGSSPYESVENVLTLLGSDIEVCFPYFIHTVEELENFLSLVGGGDNVIVS